jgi:exodeoxyribonuclease-1
MTESFFFYDLETSGLKADKDRIMQFAGQRTDLSLKPIGQPFNYLIRLTPDILPDPNAILIHGITPQQTLMEGISEAEFLNIFYQQIVQPNTTFVGFNNIRFDDEFIRYLNYRNLYDPYRWSYQDGCSRWDILDLVRITRALRPQGIKWPKDAQAQSTNKLELLTKANKLEHLNAHDAYSDVLATIEVAKLIQQNQPKLYNYIYSLRHKSAVSKLVDSLQPFIYTSSHYPVTDNHTTIVVKVADHPQANCVLVYDLRFDPSVWLKMNAQQLVQAWRYRQDRSINDLSLPVKTMRLNRCPAIAPLNVLSKEDQNNLGLDLDLIAKHHQLLKSSQEIFAKQLIKAVEILNQEQSDMANKISKLVDAQMYDGFYGNNDLKLISTIHQNETVDKIRSIKLNLSDSRLKQLANLYLSRNYLDDLNIDERQEWDSYVQQRLFSGGENSQLALYFQSINQLASKTVDSREQILLEDLKLYGESLIPSDITD